MSSKRVVGSSAPAMLVSALLFFAACPASSAEENSRVYDANCALCHQRAGVGVTGQFPRLAGRIAETAATEAGRRFLIEVVLFGMAGKVEVDGSTIIGVMPPFGVLSDDEIAATLNYLIGLKPSVKQKSEGKLSIEPEEVSKVRAGPMLSPGQVHSSRATVMTQVRK